MYERNDMRRISNLLYLTIIVIYYYYYYNRYNRSTRYDTMQVIVHDDVDMYLFF